MPLLYEARSFRPGQEIRTSTLAEVWQISIAVRTNRPCARICHCMISQAARLTCPGAQSWAPARDQTSARRDWNWRPRAHRTPRWRHQDLYQQCSGSWSLALAEALPELHLMKLLPFQQPCRSPWLPPRRAWTPLFRSPECHILCSCSWCGSACTGPGSPCTCSVGGSARRCTFLHILYRNCGCAGAGRCSCRCTPYTPASCACDGRCTGHSCTGRGPS